MLMSPDFVIVDMNQLYLEAVGRPREALVGRNMFDAFPATGEIARGLRNSLVRVVRTGKPDFPPVVHYPIPVPDETGIADRYWSASHHPILDKAGAVEFILQNTQDVTDLHRLKAEMRAEQLASGTGPVSLGRSILERAERVQALNASLLAETAQLRNLFMRAPSFMCILRGPDFRFELANSAYMTLVGQRDLVGKTVREALPEVVGQGYLELLDKVQRSGEAFVGRQMRIEFARTPGAGREEVFINFVYQPILGEDGEVAGIFVDGNDVTDHVRAEKAQALLVRELHHRVRNTLATVQGVMNSTARTAESIEEYQWAFSGRISSLARTHSLSDGGDPAIRLVPEPAAPGGRRLCRGRRRTRRARGPRRRAALAARRAARHDDPRAVDQCLPARRAEHGGGPRHRDLDGRPGQGEADSYVPLGRVRRPRGHAARAPRLRLDDPDPRSLAADRRKGRRVLRRGGVRADGGNPVGYRTVVTGAVLEFRNCAR